METHAKTLTDKGLQLNIKQKKSNLFAQQLIIV